MFVALDIIPVAAAGAILAALLINKIFTPPQELRHLPRIPALALLWSYICGEVEDARIKRLIVPFAKKTDEGVVLVFAFGRWIIHVVDQKISKDIFADAVTFPKEEPADEMLLWRFVGRTNVILSNGVNWQRHSRVVKSALNRNVPIAEFASLTRKLFTVMGNGGRFRFDDLTMRFTLDAVGTTALGHDFNTIVDNHSPFVRKYNEVMDSIASPLFLVFPKLETWFPRREVIRKIDDLVNDFGKLLEEKKQRPGNDMITYMLEEPEMTDEEYRDNMVVFFIAGHDTTAGAMSSFVYYLSKHPEVQARARREVIAALGKDEPTVENLRHTPFLQACIRESLRINTPITYVVPRSTTKAVVLKASNGRTYPIPAKASVIMNITAIHFNESYWPNPTKFDPTRFMNQGDGEEARVDASLWLPFALGPRQCPARNFAMYELRTLAAMLLQQWEWSLPADSHHQDGIKNGFSPFALSLPKDMDIIFRKVEKQ